LLSIPPHIGTITPAKENGDQLCVRVGEVGEWNINLDQCKYVSLRGDELKRFTLLSGDIVLARAIGSESHLGRLSIMGGSSIPVVFDSHLMRLRTDNSRLLTPFLANWLKTDGGRARFMQQARRTAVQFNINTEQLSSIDIPLPPLPLQQKFAQIVLKFERLRAQQREAERQAEHLFQTLLNQAFEGNGGLGAEICRDEPMKSNDHFSIVDYRLNGTSKLMQKLHQPELHQPELGLSTE
jgi:type I restriction enzyme, S subunit